MVHFIKISGNNMEYMIMLLVTVVEIFPKKIQNEILLS